MTYLWGVTLLWAFSFSLIGVYLAGQVDSYFAVLTRVSLAALLFIPWLLRSHTPAAVVLRLMTIGAIQLGCMYLFYYQSFLLLSVPEVLIFTIFTPLYITLLYDLLERRFRPQFLLTAMIAVLGAAVMRWNTLSDTFWLGFLVVQGANLCFASGQVFYKRLMQQSALQHQQHQHFGWFYLGALVIVLPAWLLMGSDAYPQHIHQWLILLWLGLAASGGGYFLWNLGATKVSSGQLAVMNDALIPAGLVVNLLIWNRDTDLTRLAIGSLIILLALWLNRRLSKRPLSAE